MGVKRVYKNRCLQYLADALFGGFLLSSFSITKFCNLSLGKNVFVIVSVAIVSYL